jgi:hypothetical protein
MAEAWIPPPDVSDVFFKYKCCITDIARALNIHRDTFYVHLKSDPELKKKFDDVQQSLANEWLDQAEKNVWYSLALGKDKPGHGLKAAMYVLDKRGKDRGWGESTNNQEAFAPRLDATFNWFEEQQAAYSARKMAETSNMNESKS